MDDREEVPRLQRILDERAGTVVINVFANPVMPGGFLPTALQAPNLIEVSQIVEADRTATDEATQATDALDCFIAQMPSTDDTDG